MDVRGLLLDNNRALSDKIVFKCQTVVCMCTEFFRGTPWFPANVNDLKKDDYNDKDYVKRDAVGRTYEEWRSFHDKYRVNVDMRATAATLIERCGITLVAVFGICYGGVRVLEAAAGWVPSPSSCVVVV